MSEEHEEPDAPKIIVDSDWKQEAAEEKARLARETQDAGRREPLPDPSLGEIINMIVMQASIGLGGMKTPTGQTLPPDHSLAKHYIDLLELLKDKTAGNATDEEHKVLDAVLHEMRMRYVREVSVPPPSSKPAT